MKKNYFIPTVGIVEIAVEAGIAGSGGIIPPPAPAAASAAELEEVTEI